MRINKYTISLFISLLAKFTHAGTLLQFEYPTLLILESKGKIQGYYESTLPKIEGIRSSPPVCVFFFHSIEKSSATKFQYLAKVFFTRSTFKKRLTSFDSPAFIYQRDSTWFVQMKYQDAGCDGAAGWNFRLGPDDPEVTRFEVTKITSALYFRLVVKKSSVFLQDKKTLVRSKEFLSPGNLVAVLNDKNNFLKIRFLHSETGKITEGWIKSEIAIDPFPK